MAGYGYYDEEGGILTGGGLKSFRQGKRGPSVPSLTWGIKKLSRAERPLSTNQQLWRKLMLGAIDAAKQEYLKNLSPTDRDKYLASKAKQQLQKERREAKKKLVLKYLQKLKGPNMQATADNIAAALKQEGNPNVRVLRAAMKILYPEIRNLPKEEREQKLREFTVRGFTIPPRLRYKYKPSSAIGFDKSFSGIQKEEIDERIEVLRGQLEDLLKKKEEVIQEAKKEESREKKREKRKEEKLT
jgi:hypothetical protein